MKTFQLMPPDGKVLHFTVCSQFVSITSQYHPHPHPTVAIILSSISSTFVSKLHISDSCLNFTQECAHTYSLSLAKFYPLVSSPTASAKMASSASRNIPKSQDEPQTHKCAYTHACLHVSIHNPPKWLPVVSHPLR